MTSSICFAMQVFKSSNISKTVLFREFSKFGSIPIKTKIENFEQSKCLLQPKKYILHWYREKEDFRNKTSMRAIKN